MSKAQLSIFLRSVEVVALCGVCLKGPSSFGVCPTQITVTLPFTCVTTLAVPLPLTGLYLDSDPSIIHSSPISK